MTLVNTSSITLQLPDKFFQISQVSETIESFLPYYAAILLATRLAYNTRRDKVFAVYRAFELGIPITILWTALANVVYSVVEKNPISLTLEYTPYW